MHEMGIAMQLVEIAKSSIPENMKQAKVEQVNLRIGKLAGVVPDSLRFCFEIITKDTQLSGAELYIEEIPVIARCKDCNTKWTVTDYVFKCEKCNSGKTEIISGRELDIISIEIAED